MLKFLEQVRQLESQVGALQRSEATGVAYHFAPRMPFAPMEAEKVLSHLERFITKYPFFGIQSAKEELQLVKKAADVHFPMRKTLNFQQHIKGIHVFGAVLKVHFDELNRIMAVDGQYVPNLHKTLDLEVHVNEERAVQIAIDHVKNLAESYQSVSWKVNSCRPLVYREGIFNNQPGPNHLTMMCIISSDDRADVKEQVFVNAKTGRVLVSIPLVFNAIRREVNQKPLLIWAA